MTENEIGTIITKTSYDIYQTLGPGLLESVYHKILNYELRKQKLLVESEVPISVNWKGHTIDQGFRADLIVHNKVLVELKSVEAIKKIHQKQTTTYLKLSNLKLGYLINFSASSNATLIQRLANNL